MSAEQDVLELAKKVLLSEAGSFEDAHVLASALIDTHERLERAAQRIEDLEDEASVLNAQLHPEDRIPLAEVIQQIESRRTSSEEDK